ncbi:cytochrome P450 10 [Strongylocentrotus purpuratus]|uniref:Cytochrome P450 n=1 Tax=Strongylocentrotus purpuratus TaxID=7668 RepID=A0A7M7RD78_STRPU|nr:cytochrome P450 10 [Strongylocentrotus purpuratus]|eukprot:XP_003727902.1 PREDICTED: cytochrome P450 10 [Strongylocentrotus purpuratus]
MLPASVGRTSACRMASMAQQILHRHVGTMVTSEHLEDAKPYDEIPGPKGVPFFGSLFDYTGLGPYKLDKLHEATVDRFRNFGPIFKETLAGVTHVHIIDPTDVRELFRNEGRSPKRTPIDAMVKYRRTRKRHIGMANTEGEEWQRLRKPVQHLLMKPQSVYAYIPIMEECADDFVTLMKETQDIESQEVPEFNHKMQRWTLESVCAIVFDTRMGCLNTGLDNNPEALDMIVSVSNFFDSLKDLTFSFPFWKFGITTKAWTKFTEAQDYFFGMSKKYATIALDRMKSAVGTSTQSESEGTFLECLLARRDFDIDSLCDLMNDLMIAAVETTASTLAFNLYCLAKNPEVQERVFQEINQAIPPGTKITAQSLQNLPYLKACIKETVRVFPTVDGTNRIPSREIALAGYRIPPDTIVRIHCIAGLMEEYFPSPEKFKPERWLRGDAECENIDPYLILPFGYGSRMCTGRRMAEQDLYIMLIKIVQNFKIEWHHEEDMELIFRLTNVPDRPAQFRFVSRT